MITSVDEREAAPVDLIHTSVREMALQQLDTKPRWNIGYQALFTETGLRVVTDERDQSCQ
jgi:hypothetical protein